MRSHAKPKFLLIRFAPGSAGRFLASMLMGSDSVAHFDPTVSTIADKMNYIKQSFTDDLASWLKTEPSDKEAWNINFVSNKYPRGEDLTDQQFTELSQQHCTDHYHNSVKEGKIIIIPWNKLSVPSFYKGDLITIYLDKDSKRWFNRSLWYKHFGIKDGMIHLKENDPKCLRPPQAELVMKFNNPILSDDSCKDFVRSMITNSTFAQQFSNMSDICSIGPHHVIHLSDLLVRDRFIAMIKSITQDLGLKEIEENYLIEGFNHWRACHEY